jgi:hypothetical protein
MAAAGGSGIRETRQLCIRGSGCATRTKDLLDRLPEFAAERGRELDVDRAVGVNEVAGKRGLAPVVLPGQVYRGGGLQLVAGPSTSGCSGR